MNKKQNASSARRFQRKLDSAIKGVNLKFEKNGKFHTVRTIEENKESEIRNFANIGWVLVKTWED